LEVLEAERVLKRLERALDRGVRAARILPQLINHCEAVSERYLTLRRAMEAGVREVAVDVEYDVADHPYPPEVLAVIKAIGWTTYVRRGDGAAYVYLFELNFTWRYYAVVPYREWPTLIGEPDLDLGGLRGFSVEAFIKYLERCGEYCRAARFCFPSPEESLREALECLERARRVVEESSFVLPLGDFSRSYYKDCYIVNDGELRSRGVRVVRPLPIGAKFSWMERYGKDRTFYCVLGEDEAKAIEEHYRAEMEGVARANRLIEGVWGEVFEKGMISDRLVRVSLGDLRRAEEEWRRFHYGWAGVEAKFKPCRHRPPDISSLCPMRRAITPI